MENRRTWVGIDPGFTGAVAVISGAGEIAVYDTPVVSLKGKHDYDLAQMVHLLRMQPAFDHNIHVILELVNAMPKQGSVSTFSFGRSRGLWEGILAALQVPYTLVSPQKWQKLVEAQTSDKNAHYLRAVQLFPAAAELLTKNRSGRSDALLIAEAGRRMGL